MGAGGDIAVLADDHAAAAAGDLIALAVAVPEVVGGHGGDGVDAHHGGGAHLHDLGLGELASLAEGAHRARLDLGFPFTAALGGDGGDGRGQGFPGHLGARIRLLGVHHIVVVRIVADHEPPKEADDGGQHEAGQKQAQPHRQAALPTGSVLHGIFHSVHLLF